LVRKYAEFLLSRQITIEEHASQYVLRSLAITLYQNDDQVQALNAIEVFKETIYTRSVQQNASESTNAEENAQPSPFQMRSSLDKTAHHMAIRFKNDTKKISGALGECWSEFISEYLYAAENYKLNPFQNFSIFIISGGTMQNDSTLAIFKVTWVYLVKRPI
jgi:hypothetical protein